MDERADRSDSLHEGLNDFVKYAFQRSGEVWDVFSFKDLAQSDQFVQIASV
jgi:hypothetical protein